MSHTCRGPARNLAGPCLSPTAEKSLSAPKTPRASDGEHFRPLERPPHAVRARPPALLLAMRRGPKFDQPVLGRHAARARRSDAHSFACRLGRSQVSERRLRPAGAVRRSRLHQIANRLPPRWSTTRRWQWPARRHVRATPQGCRAPFGIWRISARRPTAPSPCRPRRAFFLRESRCPLQPVRQRRDPAASGHLLCAPH